MGQRSIPCPQGAAWAILITRGESSVLLNFGTIYILDWIILCCGDCSLYCKILSSIPGFVNEMLVASPECDDWKWLQTLAKTAHLQSGGAKISPVWEPLGYTRAEGETQKWNLSCTLEFKLLSHSTIGIYLYLLPVSRDELARFLNLRA